MDAIGSTSVVVESSGLLDLKHHLAAGTAKQHKNCSSVWGVSLHFVIDTDTAQGRAMKNLFESLDIWFDT